MTKNYPTLNPTCGQAVNSVETEKNQCFIVKRKWIEVLLYSCRENLGFTHSALWVGFI